MYPAKDTQIQFYDDNDSIYKCHRQPFDTERVEKGQIGAVTSTKLDCPHQIGLAVVTTNNNSENISSVRYQPLDTGALDNVENFHYIPSCLEDIRPEDDCLKCTKIIPKMQKSLKKVFEFLSNNVNGERAEMIVGESAIIEHLEIWKKQGEKVEVNLTQFCETKCKIRSSVLNLPFETLPEAESNDTQFFHLRSSNLKAKDTIEEFSSVNILSGICLFSQDFGYLAEPSGTKTTPVAHPYRLIPLPIDLRPTLYEIESLIRLPNAIADIVSTFSTTLDITITLDVPRAQYYAVLLDLYAGGYCSKEHLKTSLEIIDRRHDQIARVFQKAVNDALQRRGIDKKGVRVEFSTGLAEVIPHIRETIDQGNPLSVESLLQTLLKLDPLFREYYEHLPQSQRPPQYLADLFVTSYTFQILRPVIRRIHENRPFGFNTQKDNSFDRQLLINIDNAAEWRIYSKAEKMLKEYQKKYPFVINPLLLGLFPLEHVFTAKNSGRPSLYKIRTSQYIYDESERRILSPGGVLKKVYGTGVTRRVIHWMKQEGMFDILSMSTIPDHESSSGGSSSGKSETSLSATELNSRGD